MSAESWLSGRYELQNLIGRGGMADVWKARDHRLGRDVAVKKLRTDLASDDTFQARFQREAQSAARLNHPNIVAVYDTGAFAPLDEESRDDGDPQATAPMPALKPELEGDPTVALDAGDGAEQVPYIVMERLRGTTLKELLAEQGQLSLDDAVSYAEDILDALAYSHEHGVIHRDIKPANVLLSSRPSRGGDPAETVIVGVAPGGEVPETVVPRLADFGVARICDTFSASHITGAIGTPLYMAPEILSMQAPTSAADIYSLGCLLFQALTGQVPTEFVGNDAFQECDTVGITRHCTKHNYLVKSIDDLPRILHEAFYVAANGRPGPVVIDLPKDVQFASGVYERPTQNGHKTYKPAVKGDAERIRAAGDDPSEYVEISFKVPERAYAAWPEAIRQGFEPARTVKTGALKIAILPQEDRA